MKNVIYILFLLFIFACKPLEETKTANPVETKKAYTFLALGDSYTIGESVKEFERWPMFLIKQFKQNDVLFERPKIIAKTGWRTDELLSAIEKEELNQNYDMVSLLIGVNNQFQGKDVKHYQEEFKILLENAISLCKNERQGVFVVSIPDYGATPFGKTLKPKKIAEEIHHYNKIAKTITEDMGVKFIDITELSKLARNDSKYVADDKLHPSAEMYRIWVEKAIYPSIEGLYK